MKTMQDFMEIYCMLDVLLLSEVLEMFREQTLRDFEIDPTHFISLPGIVFQVFLKKQRSS